MDQVESKDIKEISIEAEKIIAGAKECVDRGEGKGRCHVFLDHSDICVCGDVDLNKERMR